jgi:glyoxylase-like metal-dependent hydrolase (beta-lactamase superfamily II)
MKIEVFYDEATYTLTYVVHDPDTRDAVIIDPVLDYDPLASATSTGSVDEVTRFVRDRDLRVHWLLETHAHADHLSGAQLLKRRLEAPVAIGEHITTVQRTFKTLFDLPEDFATDGSQFDRLLKDGETVAAGSLEVGVIHTPGHTPACVSYRIGDAVFTGDALFMDDYGTGRCDFPAGSAEDLYHSVHDKLYALPDDTRVFVGHDYQPGGRELKWETTIGASKANNPQLAAATTKDKFVSFRRERDASLAPPRLIYQSVQVNVAGGRLPPEHDNGVRYFNLPLNLKKPTDETGQPKA